VMTFLRRLAWSRLSKRSKRGVYAGVAVVSIVGVFEYKFQECIEVVGNPARVTSPHSLFWLRVLFGRNRSRWVGTLSDLHVPVALRVSVYSAFALCTGAQIDEARYPLDSYLSFGEFFSRSLKDGVRQIADVDGLVSPVDGQVLAMGTLPNEESRIEQVKGATYSVPAFLGINPFKAASPMQYVVLYLAPGDYHRFHAPTDLTLSQGRHFCGELLPVRESLLQRMDDVFTVNERVVLSGLWKHGQMHVVPVGACNVGHIWLDFDTKLKTNNLRDVPVYCGGDPSSKRFPAGVQLSAGSLMGGFRLGSTVVLVFDGQANMSWKVSPGDRVRVGQELFSTDS